MESLLVGICLVLWVKWVQGVCDVNNCIKMETNPMFATCSAYIQTMNCLQKQFDSCTGHAGNSEIMLAMSVLNQPTDCPMHVQQMASSMTARSSMVTSMMKRVPGGGMAPGGMPFPFNPLFPFANGTGLGMGAVPGAGMMPGMFPPMMGEEMGEMEMPEPGEGMAEMFEDMMEAGMMPMPGMFPPGMMGGPAGGMMGGPAGGMMGGPAGVAGGLPGLSPGSPQPGLMGRGEGKGPHKARFYYGNAAASNKLQTMHVFWTMLAIMFTSVL